MTIKLKGHETFAIREGWLSKGLFEVSKNPKVFSENFGADALGVGSNMAKAIRYWLKAGEFIEEQQKKPTRLTNIGNIILENDKYLEDIFALWIFHINLAGNMELATSWYVFFNQINVDEFSKDEITDILNEKLSILAEGKSISSRSLKDDISVLLYMYIKEKQEDYDPEEKKISPFSQLGLIKKDGNNYIKSQPDKDKLPVYAVLYSLIKFLQYKNTDSVGMEEILSSPLSPGRILNLKRVILNEYMDSLEELGYLTVNRTAGLDMVYLNKELDCEEIIKDYYKTFKGLI